MLVVVDFLKIVSVVRIVMIEFVFEVIVESGIKEVIDVVLVKFAVVDVVNFVRSVLNSVEMVFDVFCESLVVVLSWVVVSDFFEVEPMVELDVLAKLVLEVLSEVAVVVTSVLVLVVMLALILVVVELVMAVLVVGFAEVVVELDVGSLVDLSVVLLVELG